MNSQLHNVVIIIRLSIAILELNFLIRPTRPINNAANQAHDHGDEYPVNTTYHGDEASDQDA